mmetsp:Transcript_6246/g.13624  ORF Transcript_6246/g.13624 Transcript_6246/m.13624 type:complete len:263 (+) Transcript_6246:543-1331(+)
MVAAPSTAAICEGHALTCSEDVRSTSTCSSVVLAFPVFIDLTSASRSSTDRSSACAPPLSVCAFIALPTNSTSASSVSSASLSATAAAAAVRRSIRSSARAADAANACFAESACTRCVKRGTSRTSKKKRSTFASSVGSPSYGAMASTSSAVGKHGISTSTTPGLSTVSSSSSTALRSSAFVSPSFVRPIAMLFHRRWSAKKVSEPALTTPPSAPTSRPTRSASVSACTRRSRTKCSSTRDCTSLPSFDSRSFNVPFWWRVA